MSKIIYMPIDPENLDNPVNGWLHDFAALVADKLAERLTPGEKKQEDALVSADEGRKFFHPAPCIPTFRTWMRKAGIQEHHIGNRIFYSKEQVQSASKTMKKFQRA